jgi:hypothetical protein
MAYTHTLPQDEYYPIRNDMREALERYLNHGIMPGSFLTALLENNLVEAAGRADTWNATRLHHYAGYMYNHLPSNAWGSPEKVESFIRSRRETAESDAA